MATASPWGPRAPLLYGSQPSSDRLTSRLRPSARVPGFSCCVLRPLTSAWPSPSAPRRDPDRHRVTARERLCLMPRWAAGWDLALEPVWPTGFGPRQNRV